jgi:4a-hydroxytetrahydrobiopterin dehydratase
MHTRDDDHRQPLLGDTAPLMPDTFPHHLSQLDEHWEIVRQRLLRRRFTFPSFSEAMVFVNDVAALAEAVDHHPDITVSFREVTIELTTHDVKGLSDRDFSFARKIDRCC